jgi:hypothetical protein
MMRSLFFMASLSLIALGSSPAQAGCDKDTDCKGDRICEAGACTSPSADKSPVPAPHDTGDAAAAQAPAEPAPVAYEPKDWWKAAARQTEAPILQDIFDAMPRPFVQKEKSKLLYQRAVPVVVADIHTTTTRVGGKDQVNVKFLGISKTHTTVTLEKVTAQTPGIAYCPVNCARINDVLADGENITIAYDSDIKDWGGRVADTHAGYTRKAGKRYRGVCTFPVLYDLSPAKVKVDPAIVTKIQKEAIAEINRYCGR